VASGGGAAQQPYGQPEDQRIICPVRYVDVYQPRRHTHAIPLVALLISSSTTPTVRVWPICKGSPRKNSKDAHTQVRTEYAYVQSVRVDPTAVRSGIPVFALLLGVAEYLLGVLAGSFASICQILEVIRVHVTVVCMVLFPLGINEDDQSTADVQDLSLNRNPTCSLAIGFLSDGRRGRGIHEGIVCKAFFAAPIHRQPISQIV
jgi:hypothetical protein